MTKTCEFCGRSYTVHNSARRKYCPECASNGKRYAKQFSERRKSDPGLDIHASYYSKIHTLFYKKRITKAELDQWRSQSNIRRHEVLAGEVTPEDYQKWCEESLNRIKAGTQSSLYPYRYGGAIKLAAISEDAMLALADYVKAFDACANEPDKTYVALSISLAQHHERLRSFFTLKEFDAIIYHPDEIRKILLEVGLHRLAGQPETAGTAPKHDAKPVKSQTAWRAECVNGEYVYPLTVAPHIFIGKKPAAVLFGEERVEVKSWRQVYSAIIGRCNQDPTGHEMLMYLRDKAGGKVRMFLSEKPDGMTRPLKVDDSLWAEIQYGSQTLMHILVNQILAYARFDYSNIKIAIRGDA